MWCSQAKEESELPEYLLGTVRLNRLKPESAMPLGAWGVELKVLNVLSMSLLHGSNVYSYTRDSNEKWVWWIFCTSIHILVFPFLFSRVSPCYPSLLPFIIYCPVVSILLLLYYFLIFWFTCYQIYHSFSMRFTPRFKHLTLVQSSLLRKTKF